MLATAKQKLTNDQNAGAVAGTLTADGTAIATAQTALNKGLSDALKGVSDGLPLGVLDFLPTDGMTKKLGLYALEQADLFNLLCIPPYHAPTDTLDVDVNLISSAASYCEFRRAMLLVDAPKNWASKDTARRSSTTPTTITSAHAAAMQRCISRG